MENKKMELVSKLIMYIKNIKCIVDTSLECIENNELIYQDTVYILSDLLRAQYGDDEYYSELLDDYQKSIK